jgi:hypothetical protein
VNTIALVCSLIERHIAEHRIIAPVPTFETPPKFMGAAQIPAELRFFAGRRRIADVKVFRKDWPVPSMKAAENTWTTPDVSIVFRIAGKGKGSATFWTCDLTEDYIHINANYRT